MHSALEIKTGAWYHQPYNGGFKEEFRVLRPMKNGEFGAVYRIMEKSFPDDERRSEKEQQALLEEDGYTVYILPDTNGSVKGFIAVWQFEDFGYIEHFAVDEKYRCMGLGGVMLSEAINKLCGMVCLEVEPPCGGMTSRRVGFYERCGFVLNDYPYIQPAFSPDKKAIPLKIMTYGHAVDEAEFERIKNTLYKRVYKV